MYDANDQSYEGFNPYFFIKCLPAYETLSHTKSLILDLDETLVHCSIDPIPDADLTLSVDFGGQKYDIYVQKRPHIEQFLQVVSKHFEVTVFTASQRVYADKLLNIIDPNRQLIKHRLFRDSCLEVNGNYLKDLNLLGRDLAHTIMYVLIFFNFEFIFVRNFVPNKF
eukprot:GSMAST32.ASY1.ANO1.1979.1 assembled CDS